MQIPEKCSLHRQHTVAQSQEASIFYKFYCTTLMKVKTIPANKRLKTIIMISTSLPKNLIWFLLQRFQKTDAVTKLIYFSLKGLAAH